jgi:hypothetical protein
MAAAQLDMQRKSRFRLPCRIFPARRWGPHGRGKSGGRPGGVSQSGGDNVAEAKHLLN